MPHHNRYGIPHLNMISNLKRYVYSSSYQIEGVRNQTRNQY
jgi:hypothetical protein